jgi:chromosome segregation ATPase
MSEKPRKILLLNHDSKTTEFVKNVFSETCDVTLAGNPAEVSQKADDGFDVILTGYVAPEISGEKTTSYLNNIQKVFDDAVSDLRKKTAADETLLKEREKTQADILAFLQKHVRQAEQEKARTKQEMQAVTEKSEIYLKEKIEAEEKAEAALNEKHAAENKSEKALTAQSDAEEATAAALKAKAEAEEKEGLALKAREEAEAKADAALNDKREAEAGIAKLREEDAGRIDHLSGELNRLTEELEKAMALAEQNHAEKVSIEENLTKLQDNWEKYVAGA